MHAPRDPPRDHRTPSRGCLHCDWRGDWCGDGPGESHGQNEGGGIPFFGSSMRARGRTSTIRPRACPRSFPQPAPRACPTPCPWGKPAPPAWDFPELRVSEAPEPALRCSLYIRHGMPIALNSRPQEPRSTRLGPEHCPRPEPRRIEAQQPRAIFAGD
jgi:hypothetical protein